jgi:predicted Rossmann fold nucleotide-binding protein DprA/Smf involved in DNA uptake
MIQATQFDLFTYPNSCGYKVEGTSKLAAEASEAGAKTLREQVYELLQKKALTSDECACYLHQSVLAIRPRLTELKRQGKIRETGEHRKNLSGMPLT